MARNTKAKKQTAPKAEIGAEIFASLRDLEAIKGIPVDYMVDRLKQALTNAYRKDSEDNRDIPTENIRVDLNEQGLSMELLKTAVEEVEDTNTQIHIDVLLETTIFVIISYSSVFFNTAAAAVTA